MVETELAVRCLRWHKNNPKCTYENWLEDGYGIKRLRGMISFALVRITPDVSLSSQRVLNKTG